MITATRTKAKQESPQLVDATANDELQAAMARRDGLQARLADTQAQLEALRAEVDPDDFDAFSLKMEGMAAGKDIVLEKLAYAIRQQLNQAEAEVHRFSVQSPSHLSNARLYAPRAEELRKRYIDCLYELQAVCSDAKALANESQRPENCGHYGIPIESILIPVIRTQRDLDAMWLEFLPMLERWQPEVSLNPRAAVFGG